jgi:hypothetical protein
MSDTTIGADEEIHVRPFADWLREQSGGKTHEELGVALYDLVGRVRDTGKKGTVTLTITVAPLKNDVDVLVVSDEIKLRVPEHDRKASLFYADKTGNLTRQDPGQLTFESLREVAGVGTVDEKTGEIREVGS